MENHKPVLIVIAGPNGSGKTSITKEILNHKWIENASRIAQRVLEGGHDVPIRKIIDRYVKSIANCNVASYIADRTYIYDNSVNNESARLLFRLKEGKLLKKYTNDTPEWALPIFERRKI